MLKGLRGVGVLAAAVLGLSGCHTWRSLTHSCANDADGYMQAGSVPPLRVPLGMDAPDAKSSLQIPELNEPAMPPRRAQDPCLDEPPKFIEPRGPRPPPAV
jgi:uncharacterized lipoprotein